MDMRTVPAEMVSGEVVAKGKTKEVRRYPGSDYLAVIKSTQDITAGDGAKHDLLEGKGA